MLLELTIGAGFEGVNSQLIRQFNQKASANGIPKHSIFLVSDS
jgi:hypothetical protein